jgi:cbb3-type cytochrome oxidase subunit 3
MKLADVVGATGSAYAAELALLIAAIGFAVVVVTTLFLKRNREPFERARRMPLDQEENVQ